MQAVKAEVMECGPCAATTSITSHRTSRNPFQKQARLLKKQCYEIGWSHWINKGKKSFSALGLGEINLAALFLLCLVYYLDPMQVGVIIKNLKILLGFQWQVTTK